MSWRKSSIGDELGSGISGSSRCSSSILSTQGDSDASSLHGSFRFGDDEIVSGASHSCLGVYSHGPVFSLCLSGREQQQQQQLFTGSHDNEIYLWQQQRHKDGDFILNSVSRLAAGGDGCVKALLQVTSKGKALVFSAHQDNKIRVWREGSNFSSSKNKNASFKLMAALPRARDIARSCMFPGSYVRVRRHKTCLWLQHSDTISALASSNDESLVFSCSWDRTVKVWRVSDLRCLQSFRAHDDAINAVVASSEGLVYTGSADSTVKAWKRCSESRKFVLLATLKTVTRRNSSSCAVNALVLGREGELLYAGLSNSRIKVWERSSFATGESELSDASAAPTQGDRDDHMVCVDMLRGHRGAVLCLGIAGELLCSGSADATVRIWSRGRTKHCCVGVLKGHAGPVKSLVLVQETKDRALCEGDEQPQQGYGRGAGVGISNVYFVYSGGLDRQIRVWKVLACGELY